MAALIPKYTLQAVRYLSRASMWKKVKETNKHPVTVYDVAKHITAIVKDPENTAGKTYQFVGPKRYKLSEHVALTRGTRGLFDDDCRRFNFEFTPFHEIGMKFPVKRNVYREVIKKEKPKRKVKTAKVSDKSPTLTDLDIALTPTK